MGDLAPSGSRTILVALSRVIDGAEGMGAKYLPTTKDRKASQRFQRKQSSQSKFIKSSGTPVPPKRKK